MGLGTRVDFATHLILTPLLCARLAGHQESVLRQNPRTLPPAPPCGHFSYSLLIWRALTGDGGAAAAGRRCATHCRTRRGHLATGRPESQKVSERARVLVATAARVHLCKMFSLRGLPGNRSGDEQRSAGARHSAQALSVARSVSRHAWGEACRGLARARKGACVCFAVLGDESSLVSLSLCRLVSFPLCHPAVEFRDIETTVYDPASVFLSTH
jgi:hypothetical protein